MITVRCNLCGKDDYFVRFPATLTQQNGMDVNAYRCTSSRYGAHAQIVECRHCGYVYANPRWSSDELISAYEAVEDHAYAHEREGRELTFSRHLRRLEKHCGAGKGRRLLDVGAYIGVFVEVAQQAGWDACGVEPSAWAVAIAHRGGLPVVEGTLDSPILQGKMFDLITMWDVIEHVDDPQAELRKAFQLLKPGGWIAVHTMDIDSIMARLMGRRWPWLMAMHIHYFSQDTLGQMVEQAGYEIVWSGAQGRYLSMGYLASRVAGISPILGKATKGAINTLGLNGAQLPVNFGDLFTLYARRPT